MQLNEYVSLNEGIKYFRNSEKLKKLVTQMEYDVLTKISSEEQRTQLKDYLNNVKDATKEFESIEKEYAEGNKRKAKLLYKEAKKKYGYMLSRVEKPLAGIFRQYGSSMLYFATIQLFSFLIAPKLAGIINPAPETKIPPSVAST